MSALFDELQQSGVPDAEFEALLEARIAEQVAAGILPGNDNPEDDAGKSNQPAGDYTLMDVDDSTPLPIEGKLAEDEFWGARDYLRYTRQKAHSKTEAPYALLLATLVKVCAEIPPHIVMPAVIGSEVSLNYSGVMLDTSGGGKSTVMAMSRLDYEWTTQECGITSGEGLITSYLGRSKDEDGNWVTELKTDRLLISVDESEALLAVDSRHGNTAMSHLRSMWTSGGGVGLNNKSEAEKMHLQHHEVRTAVIIGGQPTALGRVLVDDGKGTAERFVVMRLTDPTVPRIQPEPPTGPLPMRANLLPGWKGNRVAFTYDSRIREFIVETRWAEKTGNATESSVITPPKYGKVTGHKNLVIAKTAALFAAWDGRMNVTFEDWALAVHFLSVSGESRKWGLDRLAAAMESENRAAGVAVAKREMAGEEVKEKALIGKTAQSIVCKVKDAGSEMALHGLRSKLSKRQREVESEAVQAAVEMGLLVIEPRQDQSTRLGGDSVDWLILGPNAA